MTSEPSLSELAADRLIQRLGVQLSEVRAGQEHLRREINELRTAIGLHQRANDQDSDVMLVIEGVRSQIDLLEQRIAREGERGRRVGDELSELDRVGGVTDQRIEGVEGRVAALAETAGSEREERTRVDAAVLNLEATVEQIGGRLTALQVALRRTEDGLARLDSSLEREEELRQVIEQQRSVRIRLEERLRELEERLREALELLAAAAEERLALRHQTMGLDQRMTLLTESLEFQRDAVIDHFRRVLDVEEQQAKREIEEIEQGLRRGRGLLVRLRESGPQPPEEQSP